MNVERDHFAAPLERTRGELAPTAGRRAQVDDQHAGLDQLFSALDLLELEHRARAPALLARPLDVRIARMFLQPAATALRALGHYGAGPGLLAICSLLIRTA
jgi:hypothetical protein